VINCEEKGNMWYWIYRVTDDPKTGGITCIERIVEGKKVRYTDQDSMVNCIQEETEFCFHLAHSAYITKTSLVSMLSYLSDTKVVQQLIEKTYDIPNVIDDAMALVLE
jgi:hypothetical protein